MKTSKQIFLITLILFTFVASGCSRNLVLGLDGGGESSGSGEVASKSGQDSEFSQEVIVGEAGTPRLYEKPGSQSFGFAEQGMPGNGASGSFSAEGFSAEGLSGDSGLIGSGSIDVAGLGTPSRMYEKPDSQSFGFAEQGMPGNGSSGSFSAEPFSGGGGSEFFSEANISESGAPSRMYEKPDSRSFGSAKQGMPGNGSSGSFSAESFGGDGGSLISRMYEKADSRSFGSAKQGMPGNGSSGSFSAEPVIDESDAGPDVSEDEIRRQLAYSPSDRLQDIHFALDKFDLDDISKVNLEKNVAYLKAHPNTRIEIQGHCDERGSNNYNITLGERRAQSTKSYLVSLGVEKSRIHTISYGEEKPFCTESNEKCWHQNRRGHFLVAE